MGNRNKERWYRIRPAQFIIYLVFRSLILIVGLCPYGTAFALSRVLGTLIRWFDIRQRKYAAEGLEQTNFTKDVPGMVRRLYRHYALNAMEVLMLPRLMQGKDLSRFVKMERFDIFDRELERGKGVIAVIAHLGNWELAGLASTLAGYPLNSLAQPLENPFLERWLRRLRTSTGQAIISKFGALRSMVQVLRSNKILVIQADHDAKLSGILIKFLGKPALAVRSPAVFSLKYGAPIVPANIYRDRRGMHHLVLTDPIYPDDYRDEENPIREMTQAYNSRFEEFIRQHPEQWTWSHRRWRTVERRKYARQVEEMSAKAGFPL